MGLYFRDNDGNWDYTENDNYIKVYQCIQEILIWRGEVSFNILMGVDYEAIFNSTSFLTAQVEEIISKYNKFFKNISLKVTKISSSSFAVDIDFYFKVAETNPNIFGGNITRSNSAPRETMISKSLVFKQKGGKYIVATR